MSQQTRCNTCTRPDHSPFRVYDQWGHVVAGCVDACHTGRLVTPSASASWYHRPQAKAIRAGLRRMQQGR